MYVYTDSVTNSQRYLHMSMRLKMAAQDTELH